MLLNALRCTAQPFAENEEQYLTSAMLRAEKPHARALAPVCSLFLMHG